MFSSNEDAQWHPLFVYEVEKLANNQQGTRSVPAKVAPGEAEHRLSLRLSSQQLAELKRRAGDMPLATYIRRMALGGVAA